MKEEVKQKYRALLNHLNKEGIVEGLTGIVRSHYLNLNTTRVLLDMGILYKGNGYYYWVEDTQITDELIQDIYTAVEEINLDQMVDKSMQIDETWQWPQIYQDKFNFAKVSGFGDHSPVSQMIGHLGSRKAFEKKFNDYCKRVK